MTTRSRAQLVEQAETWVYLVRRDDGSQEPLYFSREEAQRVAYWRWRVETSRMHPDYADLSPGESIESLPPYPPPRGGWPAPS